MPVIAAGALAGLSDLTGGLELGDSRIVVMLGILLISLFAVSFPGVSKQIPFLRIPHLLFFIGKHFGTGAILSTAFCHLLPDAFGTLQDPDVNKQYNGIGKWTGPIILGSLLSIFLVEYISTAYVDLLHAKPSAPPSPSSSRGPSRPKTPITMTSTPLPSSSLNHPTFSQPAGPSSLQASNSCHSPNCSSVGANEHTPLIRAPKRTKSLCSLQEHRDNGLLSLIFINSPRLARGNHPHPGLMWGRDTACICHLGRVTQAQTHATENAVFEEGGLEEQEKDAKPKIGRKRQVVGILILQLGIMIHSLVIGLTLAITSGTDFTSLVTAIIFHQLFEGLSLGIRIAGLPPPHTDEDSPALSDSVAPFPSTVTCDRPPSAVPNSRSKSWHLHWLAPTLSVLFAITTPAGMVLGTVLFKRRRVVEDSPQQIARMHLTQGLMSGISAGMLIYAATVEMLAGDFVFGDISGDHGHGEHNHNHNEGEEHIHTHGSEEPSLSPISRKVLAVCSLLSGATAMALVGLGE